MQGPGRCDHNKLEQTANLVTSIPFLALGLQALRYMTTHGFSAMPVRTGTQHSCTAPLACRQARTSESRLYGASIVGVAAGSCAFHGANARWRPLCRKLDYWGQLTMA